MATPYRRDGGCEMSKPKTKGNGRGITLLRSLLAHEGDECVIWPFHRIRGYGVLGVNGEHYKAHRLMCEMIHGPAPSEEYQAAHSCGNGHGGCVNPRHLSWKTPTENQADRKIHGTSGRRMPGRRYKLTIEQVAQIRALKGQKSQDEIATMFGCTRENIGLIHRGINWPSVPAADTES